MGIADIFEALTANDRPYKKAMNLSQALKIMDNFKANGHIDPDLYEVFLAKQVHKRYAERFLAPAQIDL
jgi:HD-GYP domain-containing protein (c-di-GMP phosphodiesterase class II)